MRLSTTADGSRPVPRGLFRDWSAGETDDQGEVIEAALAHVVHNKVEAAYARSGLSSGGGC